MPRKIEATVSPDLFNLLRDETKRRGRRLHVVAGELLAERLTLEAAPSVLETPSMSKAPRTRRRKKTSSGSSAPKTSTPSSAPADHTEGTPGSGSSD
jgi:hypothetical protein